MTSEAAAAPSRPPPRTFPLGPAITFIAVWLGGSWLAVGALLQAILPGGWATVAALLALGALPIFVLVRGLSGALYPSAFLRLLVLRPFWYAMLFLPMLAICGGGGALVGLPFGASGAVGRWTLAAVTALLAIAAAIGWAGSRQLVVRPLEVRMPRLPSAFDGLSIVQISDLHVGPQTSRSFLGRVAACVQQARADLIVITGDQVDDFARDVELFNAAFADLSAPLGVFTVAGNHDVYAGWSAVHQGLANAGFEVLVNEARPIEKAGQRLWLAGTGDPAGRGWPPGSASVAPDIERALQAVLPGEPVVALAHNPALWPELAGRGVDLTLSGHTHYGQFAIPGLRWSLASPFVDLAMGVHRRGRSLLHIHPGTNYWGIPFRIGTPPEVSVLTLRRAGDGEDSSIRPKCRGEAT